MWRTCLEVVQEEGSYTAGLVSEFGQQFWCVEVFGQYPLIMHWRVALPSDKVLLLFSLTMGTFLENLHNFPFWFAFHDVRWWF
jgi:hypothetical protein